MLLAIASTHLTEGISNSDYHWTIEVTQILQTVHCDTTNT